MTGVSEIKVVDPGLNYLPLGEDDFTLIKIEIYFPCPPTNYDICSFTRVGSISIYMKSADIWFLPGNICKKHIKSQPQHIV